MPMPPATALHHTCFLVRDLESTAQALSDSLGVGPWNLWTIEPAECRVNGEESLFTFRVALAQVGVDLDPVTAGETLRTSSGPP